MPASFTSKGKLKPKKSKVKKGARAGATAVSGQRGIQRTGDATFGTTVKGKIKRRKPKKGK